MAAQKNQESREMYLETILRLTTDHPDVHSVEVAAELGFSKPSVSVALKNLKEQGYITVNDDNHINLTDSGRVIAEMIFERHETFTKLFIAMGVPAELAEEDACRIEHYVSEETFRIIKDYASRNEMI